MNRMSFLFLLLLAFPVAANSQGAPKAQPAPADVTLEPLTAEETLKLILINRLETEAQIFAMAPTAEMARESPSVNLAQLYKEAAASPRLMRQILGQHRDEYRKSHTAARSAPQASQAADEASVEMLHIIAAQNMAIIEQNAHIISLLERIARGR